MGPILVTGAAGVVGSHVVKQLIRGGHEVAAADILSSPGPLLAGLDDSAYHRIDIRDPAVLQEVFAAVRPQRVIHLAALVGEWYNRHPLANNESNLGGTVNMLEACRLSGVERIVFASTWSLYPAFAGTPHGHPDYVPVPEDTPPAPHRPYEIVKYACERYALWYRDLYDLEFAAVRFGGYYAAERLFQKEVRATTPLNQMIRAASAGESLEILQGGDQGYDAVYVKDCAAGCVAAVLAPATPSGIYNIGTGRPSTIRQAADILMELVPGIELKVGPGLQSSKHYCVLDITRARTELGYEPGFDLRRGLTDCLARIKQWQSSGSV